MDAGYIDGCKAAPVHIGNVLVLGLGKSGRAVSEYCLGLIGTRIDNLVIAAGEQNESAAAFARECERRGATVVFDTYVFEGSYDLCIASPGISQFSRFYENAAACSTEVISEVEFAWRESRSESVWIAITGTNGKTTTTTLTYEILKAAGLPVAAVGNIGNTCIEAVAEDQATYYVAEVSSFQLASMSKFAPDVAVLLNITPDHLYWHMTFEAYVDAKKSVYSRMKQGVVVIDAVNDIARSCVKEFKNDPDRGFSYIPIGCAAGLDHSMAEACGSENAAYMRGDDLLIKRGDEVIDLLNFKELNIKGGHNASNALAAACAALSVGVSVPDVRRALRAFKPLEHRMEPCGSIDGVNFINDSKATNVDATLKALDSFESGKAVFLLGGHDKGTDLAELAAKAAANCKAVVCFGAAGKRFYNAFDDMKDAKVKRLLTDHMEDALDAAISICEPGDSVVLSPACASFDEFDSFEHRGRVFKHLVAFRAYAKKGE
ncbi:UDP-N-acetylmuramoyl-L-alanine--D-glutamate ligase [Slackia heliotrinireducens]|uniref:UDP-N-acetylmuramoyl-L-alanine--D-glutamate ligase n=1 Tax=Slackia heliotrinireducens TaxID=84110 RepID=UPI00331527BF